MAHTISTEDEFADDVLIFVMKESLTDQRSQRNLKQQRTSSPFTNEIRILVRRHLEQHDVEIRNIFNMLLEYGNLNEYFKDYATAMANIFVQRGYKEKEFIEFCALITKLATLAYMNNFKNCITPAATVIVEVIKHFKATGDFTTDGWDKLSKVQLI
ncbi:uncharacterized protein TNCT_710541 [Trichonephila clavata]|uniref:Uncharacterized protein n=1 Tax=Trichonephila clavata TaxID=2740835 RepID=A0A8X6KEN9_TRICU|nr:uncharacterized protein TNCT_710541 [Trichonephila clavata]